MKNRKRCGRVSITECISARYVAKTFFYYSLHLERHRRAAAQGHGEAGPRLQVLLEIYSKIRASILLFVNISCILLKSTITKIVIIQSCSCNYTDILKLGQRRRNHNTELPLPSNGALSVNIQSHRSG